MNDKQKIFVMVGVGSLVVFLFTLTGWKWELSKPIYYDRHTNYIGLICIFNVVVSLVGFILYKD